MRKRLLAAGGGTVLAGGALARRYRRDTGAARARLAAVDRTVIQTPSGAVEYAERGAGEPLLAIHAIFGGCDQGLISVDDLFPARRVIAPSRFGYLGSALPPGATPADQADAFTALLDALQITRTDAVAFSAGAASALQLALRHPGRVSHLVVISGYWPGGPTAKAAPQANRLLVRSEFPMWTLRTFARPIMDRLAGVPKGFPLTAADTGRVTGILDSMVPVLPRAEGVIFDFFTSFPDVNHYELEAITVPVLIVHAADDPVAPYDGAQRAAGRIPGARLIRADRGGHLMLGRQQAVRAELAAFVEPPGLLATRPAPTPGPGSI
jgi:pimeloyl-ACP methyl ester carboxylesterase